MENIVYIINNNGYLLVNGYHMLSTILSISIKIIYKRNGYLCLVIFIMNIFSCITSVF